MMTLNEVRAALQDRRLEKVARATGLHYNTVKAIRDGKSSAPTWQTVKALSDYLTDFQ